MKRARPVAFVAAVVVLSVGVGLPASGGLITQHDSGVGVTGNPLPTVTNWTDQATAGGSQNFAKLGSAGSSAYPTLITKATPTGKAVLQFNGALSNPNQLLFGATSSFDSAPSLTFMMVLKPGVLTDVVDTYLNSAVNGASGSGNGWGLYRNSSQFYANARGSSTDNSTISTNLLAGGGATNWMVLTGVYTDTGADGTVQLFLTDAGGVLHTGNVKTITGGMTAGVHLNTDIGARGSGRLDGAAMDVASIRIWNEALSPAARSAAEMELYYTYIKARLRGTLIAIK
jgi:hypothetical protein